MAAIRLLDAQHRREGFDCGDTALNEFLLRQAGQQQRRGFGKTYVALAGGEAAVIGFVTVSAGQIATASLSSQSRLPRYPAPMLRIGRLAVDMRHQGKGIGQDLLAFSLRLAVEFSQRVGLYAVVVDAKNNKAKAFHEKLGFIACVDNPLCVYLPIATLEQIIVTGSGV
jgi:predicted N-acetyltransferase YhbS